MLFRSVGTNGAGSVHPAWTEIGVCPGCGLASRQRAIMAYIFDRLSLSASSRIYVAERVTPSYEILKTRFPQTIGSEYLGANFTPGQKRLWMKGNFMVRHEDITNISFDTNTFDLVLTQDVFEHIPNFVDAFAECNRVLIPGGRLVFSIPFFPHSEKTVIRAEIQNGDVIHLMEPEWHGNPVGEGSLCFQHFAWDILEYLKGAGFSEASASWYWGPWQGHIGVPFFVFSATASG